MKTRYECPTCGEEYDSELSAAACCPPVKVYVCERCDWHYRADYESAARCEASHTPPAPAGEGEGGE